MPTAQRRWYYITYPSQFHDDMWLLATYFPTILDAVRWNHQTRLTYQSFTCHRLIGSDQFLHHNLLPSNATAHDTRLYNSILVDRTDVLAVLHNFGLLNNHSAQTTLTRVSLYHRTTQRSHITSKSYRSYSYQFEPRPPE